MKFESVKKQKEMPYTIASQSNLSNLKNTASEKELLNPQKISLTIKAVEGVSRELRTARETLKAEKQDSEIITTTLDGILFPLRDRLLAYQQFSSEISPLSHKAEKSPEQNLGIRIKAVEQLQNEIKEFTERLSNVPIQSAFNVKNITRIAKKVAGVVALVTALGILLKSDGPDHHPNTTTKKEQPSFKKKLAPSMRDLMRKQTLGQGVDRGFGQAEGSESMRSTILGSITFTEKSNIKDPLWISDIAVQGNDRNFYTIDRRSGKLKDRTEAEVKINPRKYEARESYALFSPLGHSITEVKTSNKESKFVFNSENQTITFKEPTETEIIYNVVEGSENIDRARPTSVNRTQEETQLIQTLKENPDAIRENLRKHLSKFIYITSDEVNDFFGQLPGTFEDKVGKLKIGDCSVLSCYIASILNDADIPAAVAQGFLQNFKNEIEGASPHMKAIYKTSEGWVTFETTAYAKKVYRDLKLRSEDQERMNGFLTESAKTNMPTDRILENYKTLLDDILRDPYYDKFEKAGLADTSEKMSRITETVKELKKIYDKIVSYLDKHFDTLDGSEIAFEIILGILIIIGLELLALRYGLGDFINEKIRQFGSRVNQKDTKRTAKLFEMIRGSIISGHTETDTKVIERLRDLYKHYELSALEELIPLKEAEKMSRSEQIHLLTLFQVVEMTRSDDWSLLNNLKNILNGRQWNLYMERLKAEGFSLDGIIDYVKQRTGHPEYRKKLEAQMPELIDTITQKSQKILANVLQDLNIDKKMGTRKEIEEYVLAIGIESKDHLSDTNTNRIKGREFQEHSRYQPGHDPRSIDWRLYARSDQLHVKNGNEENERKSENSYTIQIDIEGINNEELIKLGSLLLLSQQMKSRVSIESISFVQKGEIIDRFGHSMMLALQNEKLPTVRSVIEKIMRMKLDTLVGGSRLGNDWTNWNQNVKSHRFDYITKGIRPPSDKESNPILFGFTDFY